MTKRPIFLTFWLVFISACQPDVNLSTKSQFTAVDDAMASGQLQLDTEQPFVEQPIRVSAVIKADEHLNRGTIVGINMNMGSLPVVWRQQTATRWVATFMLGACTEPNMQWQLQTPVYNDADEVVRILHMQFTTVTTE